VSIFYVACIVEMVPRDSRLQKKYCLGGGSCNSAIKPRIGSQPKEAYSSL